jgi:hypothetical protein
MRFLFCGCSYTVGDELLNQKNSRFSKLICDHFKAKEINLARNGYGNDNIVMSAVEFLEKDKDIDFVLIQISGISRITIPNSNKSDIDRKPYMVLNPMDGTKTSPALIAKLLINGTNITHNHLWYRLNRYKIILLESYLKSLGVPYLFCVMHKDIDYFRNDKELPKSFTDNLISKSLVEIGRENNFSFGKNNHPLEEAHAFYASDIFIPKIEKII